MKPQSLAQAMTSCLATLGGDIQTGWTVGSIDELPPARAYLFDITPATIAAHRRASTAVELHTPIRALSLQSWGV